MYACADGALIRLATCSTTDPLPDAPNLAEDSTETVLSWLRNAWVQAGFGELITEASPVLEQRVRRVLDVAQQSRDRELRRVCSTVLRYVLRARTRATPFGLFAGIAPAHAGSVTSVERDPHGPRAHARIDATWLDRVITTLEQSHPLRCQLPVVANTLATVRDNRIVLEHQRSIRSGPVDVSVRYTRPVALALETAGAPRPLADLVEVLRSEFSHTSTAVIERMLDALVDQRLLVTSLHPPMTVTDPLAHVLAVLDTLDHAGLPAETIEVIAALREVAAELSRHNTPAPRPADPGRLRRGLSTRMRSLVDAEATVTVDLHADRSVSLPGPVWTEAATAADVLTRVSPHPTGTTEWADYHHRFLDRYGLGAHVPLRDLLDPDTGLGYPAGYRGSLLPAPPSQGVSPRDGRLFALAQQAAIEQRREIDLDEHTVAALEADAGTTGDPRPHSEISFRLQATSREAIDQGAFRLAVASLSRAAGTMTGRFLDVLDKPDQDRLRSTYANLPSTIRNAAAVQLSCPPLQTRTHNVARHPRVLPELLALSEHAPDGLALDELAVTGDLDRLYLVSRRHGHVVEPLVFHAVEFTQHTHPLARFLAEITTARAPTLGPFSWGAAARLPYLPRVRYHRSILAPAQWIVSAGEVPSGTDQEQWCAALQTWRDRWQVPAEVCLGDGDQRLHLNLNDPAHQQLLREETDRGNPVLLREAPPAGSLTWIDGHAHELVVPVTSTSAATTGPLARPGGPTVVRNREHGHLPGAGPWFYAQLQAHPDRHTLLLTEHVPRLLASWDHRPQWWFLRYDDPHPHLRLRIRLDEHSDFATTAARVGAWADDLRQRGLAGDLSLHTYRPEIGRFGTGTALRAAEDVFAADSAAALTQLAAARPTGTPVEAITAASLVQLAIGYLDGIEAGVQWLLENIPRTHAPAPQRQLRDRALAVAAPHEQWAALRELPGGEDIVAAWHTRDQALSTYRQHLAAPEQPAPTAIVRDLAHLHHVRMHGIAPEHERASLHLARAAAVSIAHRRSRGAA